MAGVVVVGAAILRGGRVLAAQRATPAALAGMWEFPGGKVEPGESEAEALIRECREELGCDIEVGELLGEAMILDGSAVLRVWLSTIVSGEPRPMDHLAVRWLASDELNEVDWIPADRPLVEVLGSKMAPD